MRIVKFALAVLTAALVVGAVATAGASGGEPPSSPGLSLKPVVGPPVKPGEFRGDVRRIPRGAVIQPDERPAPRSPDETLGGPTSDPAVQGSSAGAPAPAPTNSFAGLDFAGWGAGWPPDTNGDVGPTHYIQTVNTSIGIFDKATGTRVAAFTFDDFFSGTGTPCDDANQGDPVVVYDPIGDRWIVSDFAWSNYTSGAMYQCFAVSKSADPVNGGWWFYAFQTETGGVLPDYPKLGVWPDAIYMSANDFATTGSGSFQNVQAWAFDRAAMEAGASATSVSFTLPRTVGGVTVFSLLPSNARSVTGLPASGTPNYFASIWGAYDIRVWKFHVDFASPASSTFTGPTNVPIATFNVGPSTVPEKSGNNLDTLSYRLMMQNQYTKLNGVESLWLTHTVGSGGSPNRAQPRWYQLKVTGGVVASSPTQQSTWAPDSKNRFMPSLAVDANGDMALGYSVSDSTMYPAIRYAGRLAADPLGTLGQGETSLIEGTGFQCCTFSSGSTNTRWGDYSAMSIDPDGCTFWYTNEYYDTLPTTLAQDNWKTRDHCDGSEQRDVRTDRRDHRRRHRDQLDELRGDISGCADDLVLHADERPSRYDRRDQRDRIHRRELRDVRGHGRDLHGRLGYADHCDRSLGCDERTDRRHHRRRDRDERVELHGDATGADDLVLLAGDGTGGDSGDHQWKQLHGRNLGEVQRHRRDELDARLGHADHRDRPGGSDDGPDHRDDAERDRVELEPVPRQEALGVEQRPPRHAAGAFPKSASVATASPLAN